MAASKRGRKKTYTVDMICEALRESSGLVTLAARRLGCSHTTIQRALKDSKKVRDARHEAREAFLDSAEESLMKKVEDGDLTAIIFTLKTLGKGRGYVERQEIDMQDHTLTVKLPEELKGGDTEQQSPQGDTEWQRR